MMVKKAMKKPKQRAKVIRAAPVPPVVPAEPEVIVAPEPQPESDSNNFYLYLAIGIMLFLLALYFAFVSGSHPQ
jgi:hypothetical protein